MVNQRRRVYSPYKKLPVRDPIAARVDALADQLRVPRTILADACYTRHASFNRQLTIGQLYAWQVPFLAAELGVSVHYLLTGEDDWAALAAKKFDETRDLLEHCVDLYSG